MSEEQPTSRRRSIAVRVLLGLLVLVVAALVGIHLPPVETLILRTLLPFAEGRANLRIAASRLDYNLFRLRATVSGVRVAATQTPDQPFFEADSVTVAAPASVLRGIFALNVVEIHGGRVAVRQTADGSNLPTSSSTSTEEPAALHLGHVSGDLAVDVRDDVAGYRVNFPRLLLDLSPLSGQLSVENGEIGFRDQTIAISRLSGGATFDGRTFGLQGMNLASDVANAQIDGTVTVITRTPALDVRLTGDGNVARLTALATPTKVFDGDIRFTGTLAGPFSSPVADMRVTAARLDRERLALTDVDVTTRVGAAGADVSRGTFGVAGGRVEVKGHLAFDAGSSAVDGTWTNVDIAALLGALVDGRPILPAGSIAGTMKTSGTGFDLTRWTTSAQAIVGGAANARSRLAIPGQSRLSVRNGVWRLEGTHTVGAVSPVGFALNGRFTASGGSSLGGDVEVNATPLADLAGVLTRVGVADLSAVGLRAGTLTATSAVGGTLNRPTIMGSAELDRVAAEQFSLGATRVTFDGAPLDSELGLDVRADSLQAAGQEVDMVAATGQLHGSELVLNSFSAAERGGPGTLVGSGRYRLDNQAYDLQARASNWLLDERIGSPVRGLANFSFTGAGTVDRPAGEAQLAIADAVYANVALGNLNARTVLDGVQATVFADAPALNLQARGLSTLRAPYDATLDVDVQGLDIARFQPLMSSQPTSLQGTVTASAHAEGPLSRWRDATATLDLTAADALIGDLKVALDGPSQITYGMDRLTTTRLAVQAGGLRAELNGSLPVETVDPANPAVTMTVIGDVGDIVAAVRATRTVDVPAISGEGPVAVLARVEGSVRAPDISADVDLGPASITAPDIPTVERLRMLAHVENGRADVQDLVGVIDGAEVMATASAPLSWVSDKLAPPSAQAAQTMATLSATLKNVTASLLSRLATGGTPVSDVAGSLDATVELSSPTPRIADLTGEVRLDRLELTAASVALSQTMPTRIVAGDGLARIASWEWTGEGTNLSVAGQVNLTNLQAGILADGNLDLRLLSPFLRSSGLAMAGTVAPRLSVTGEITHPQLDGDIAVNDAEMRMSSPRVFVSGLNGRAVFSRDRLQLTGLSGAINGGTLDLGGFVALPAQGSLTAALTAELKDVALDYPKGLRTELDGSLMFDLGDDQDDLERVPLLSGSVTVKNGSYREPILVVGGLLGFLQSTGTAAPPSSSSTPVALDITVRTDDDIVVDNNLATLSLGADVRVIGTTAQPALSGRAEVREGGRVLLGRNNYEVTAATLDFSNPDRIEPELDLQLKTVARGITIDVNVTGTPAEPKMALSSEDSDFGETDLRAILLTGRPYDQLNTVDAALVSDVVVGNLSSDVGQVLGLAGRAVGLDSIQLVADATELNRDPVAVATDTDPTSRLTFTKSVGTNLDIILSQSLSEGSDQTWIVEYTPRRRLLARLVSDDDNLRRYEFRHEIQFGANTRTRAQATPAPSRPALRVSEVTIDGVPDTPELRGRLSLKPKAKFDFGTLQDDRDRLERVYRDQGYLTVRVGARQTTTDDMVAVMFTVQPGPRTRIDVVGEPLSKDIVDAVAAIWADSIAGPLLVDEARELIAARLADQGYLRAMVRVDLAETGDVQVLSIAATPGPRTTQVSVELDGVDNLLADTLNARLRDEKLVPQAPRNPQAIVTSLEQGLRERGYGRPKVIVDSPVFDGAMALVRVHIQPGAPMLLGPVMVAGTTLPADRIRQALDLNEGAPFEQTRIDNAQSRLVSLYRQEGYASAKVDIETMPAGNGLLGVSVQVVEGPRQVISNVHVEGLRGTAEDVALTAMKLDVGQPARSEDLLRARTRLFGTGLFRRVDLTTSPDPEAATDPAQVPLKVLATVEEWPTVRLRYGFQVAEERPEDAGRRRLTPGVSGDVTRRTTFGRAISVGAATVLQRDDRLGRVFATSPTLFSAPVRSTLSLEKQREEFTGNLVTDTTRISWEQRSRVFGRVELSYAYKFERLHTFRPPDPNFPTFDVSLRVARLTGNISWDTRDDPSNSTRGSWLTSSIEDAPAALLSQIRYVRYLGRAYHFQPVGKIVLASAFQYGVITPLGGQEVIPSKLFLTGGSTSIRGLAEDGAGPRDAFGPLGGRALMLINQEVRFPMYKWFGGVGFVDAGNVFTTPRDVSFGDLATSIGVGLRISPPKIPIIRIDYGHLVQGWAPGDARSRWVFAIGQAF